MTDTSDNNPLLTQVGGDHYKKLKIQPVQLWLANDLGPIEAACVKYLTRWRDKGGVEDLRKVQHFIELLRDYVRTSNELIRPHRIYITAHQYCVANGIDRAEQEIIDRLIRWRTSGLIMLNQALTETEELIAANI